MDKNKLEELSLLYFQNEEPVPFVLSENIKDEPLFIYPICVKEYPIYEKCIQMFDIDKNTLGDLDIVKMSYLEFYKNVLFAETSMEKDFLMFLKLILHKDYIRFATRNNSKKIVLEIGEMQESGSIKIVSKILPFEFNEIKTIALFQNDIRYNDDYISPEIRQEINTYCQIKYRDTILPTLEKKKAYVISKTGMKMKDINEMTYRSFSLVFNSCLDSENYIAQKIIQASSKYEVKDNIIHPLYAKEYSILDEVFSMTNEQVAGKINSSSG